MKTTTTTTTIFVFVFAVFTLLFSSCSQQDNPYAGEWQYSLFCGVNGGYDTVTHDDNGNFEFDVDFAHNKEFHVVGNVNADGELTAQIFYQGTKVGWLQGSAAQAAGFGPESCIVGSYNVDAYQGTINCTTTPANRFTCYRAM